MASDVIITFLLELFHSFILIRIVIGDISTQNLSETNKKKQTNRISSSYKLSAPEVISMPGGMFLETQNAICRVNKWIKPTALFKGSDGVKGVL